LTLDGLLGGGRALSPREPNGPVALYHDLAWFDVGRCRAAVALRGRGHLWPTRCCPQRRAARHAALHRRALSQPSMRVHSAVDALGVHATFHAVPDEVRSRSRSPDTVHSTYDPEWANASSPCSLNRPGAQAASRPFSGRFPVHFFWACDPRHTRYSGGLQSAAGRRGLIAQSEDAGGIVGFWPGSGAFPGRRSTRTHIPNRTESRSSGSRRPAAGTPGSASSPFFAGRAQLRRRVQPNAGFARRMARHFAAGTRACVGPLT
jgi:hypothetical protein